MKHNIKVTLILLGMFLLTQLIGLAVINAYTLRIKTVIINGTEQNITISPFLPYGMQPPEIKTPVEFLGVIPSLIFAFIIAIVLVFILSKFKMKSILKAWFFFVVILAIGITLNSLLFYLGFPYASIIAALIAIPLAFYKIFKRNLLVHNVTELMVYPGIAAVFVSVLFFQSKPLFSILAIIFLLLLISAYDIYAVWHSGFMQKMAKFQINQLKIFAGFFVPYMGKKDREKIQLLKQKYQNKKIPSGVVRKKKIKVSLAILGGGDVVFPIIAAGIFLRSFGIGHALLITLFATLSLAWLFVLAKKGKFYPAMPFITAGIFLGMLAGLLL